MSIDSTCSWSSSNISAKQGTWLLPGLTSIKQTITAKTDGFLTNINYSAQICYQDQSFPLVRNETLSKATRLKSLHRIALPWISAGVTPCASKTSSGVFITRVISFIRLTTSTDCACIASMNHFRSSSLNQQKSKPKTTNISQNQKETRSKSKINLRLRGGLVPSEWARLHFSNPSHFTPSPAIVSTIYAPSNNQHFQIEIQTRASNWNINSNEIAVSETFARGWEWREVSSRYHKNTLETSSPSKINPTVYTHLISPNSDLEASSPCLCLTIPKSFQILCVCIYTCAVTGKK